MLETTHFPVLLVWFIGKLPVCQAANLMINTAPCLAHQFANLTLEPGPHKS